MLDNAMDYTHVRNQIENQAVYQVNDETLNSICGKIEDRIWNQVCNRTRHQVDLVDDQVLLQFKSQVQDQLKNQVKVRWKTNSNG